MKAPRVPLVALPVAAGLLLAGAIAVHRSTSLPHERTGIDAAIAARQGSLVVSTDTLQFGAMEIGRAVERPLLLRNSGGSPLRVKILSSGSAFGVEPAETSLEPGAIVRVHVVGTRLHAGILRGELEILAEASNRDPIVVALEGGAPDAPDVSIASSSVGAGFEARADAAAPVAALRAAPGVARPSLAPTRSTTPAAPGPGSWAPIGPTAQPHGMPTAGTGPGRAVLPQTAVVPFDPATARAPRSISDVPESAANRPAREGERPVPLRSNPRSTESNPLPTNPAAPPSSPGPTTSPTEPDPTEPTAAVTVLTILSSSSLSILGTTNQFYAQQVPLVGAAGSGSFRLASELQMPRIPLAFGQSMSFQQTGAASGSIDVATGQVTIEIPMEAVDSNGNTAPLVVSLTTGTVVTRNASGVLVSVTGQARSADSGQLRLVGLGKIPTGFRNGAEEQLVTLDLKGQFDLTAPDSARLDSGSASSGAQENL